MFIELTDYDGVNFLLNVNAIISVRDNERNTIVCTLDTQYVASELYSEVIERLKRETKII